MRIFEGNAKWDRKAYLDIENHNIVFDTSGDEYGPVEFPVIDLLKKIGLGDNGGVARIAAERLRQIVIEGWTYEHDDKHVDDEMARAASAYASPVVFENEPDFPIQWPEEWDKSWYKPTPEDRIRELEKAGALIAAEIDRLTRLQKNEEQTGTQG